MPVADGGSILVFDCVGAQGEQMEASSKGIVRELAERTGWSLARTEGYIDGEMCRRNGKIPPAYPYIGIDDYCVGFRASYFERENIDVLDMTSIVTVSTPDPTAHLSSRRAPDSVTVLNATISPVTGA